MVVRTIWGGIVKIRPSPGPERELQKTWPGYDEDTVLLGYAQPTPGALAILNERTTNEISSLKRCKRFFFSSFRFLPMFWRLAISWGRRNSKFDLYPNLVVINWVLGKRTKLLSTLFYLDLPVRCLQKSSQKYSSKPPWREICKKRTWKTNPCLGSLRYLYFQGEP